MKVSKKIKSNIYIYFYYNEQKDEFVEIYTDINLNIFQGEKLDSIFTFINSIDIDDII